MEFTNFYNIKTEGGMGGWPVAATPPPHTDKAKVNPFMQWAVASIQGFYFSGPQGVPQPGAPGGTPTSELPGHPPSAPSQPSPVATPGHSQSAKPDEQARPTPVTITASSALETGRQAVQAMPAHYNHGLHPMVPIDPAHHHHHQQQQHQQQQHHPQHQQQTQQPQQPHQPQQHQPQQQQQSGECGNQSTHSSHGPSNDTAFPGASHRHSYNVQGGGQHGGGQTQGQVVPGHNSHPTKQVQGEKQVLAPLTKNKLYTEENGQVIAYNGSQEHLEHHRRGVKVERVYDCSDCDKAFTREEHLKRHAKSHTDEPVHRCEVVGCNKAYTRKERLTRHYKVAHLGQEPERPFWCPECGKDFQRKEHLTRHQRNIHGPGGSIGLAHSHHSDQSQGSVSPVSMTILGPAQPSNLHSLGQQHAGESGEQGGGGGGNNHGQGQLRCTYDGCPKTYSRREHLNRHIKLHMGIEPERPYYCLDCGKTFTRKEHLLRHRRSHTGETPYHCPGVDCSKQFARKEHLKRHMRVHTGEHPYPCSECGRSFGRRERLLKHLKSHGIGVMPGAPIRTVHHMQQHHQHQPKKEFKKEPEFISSDQPQAMPHGVFGDQTNHLLRMIAQKGPLTPEQLGLTQAVPTNAENFFSNPEVARALSNPEIVRAFSNPEVVKAFAFSPPKRGPGSNPTPPAVTQAPQTSHTPQPTQPSQAAQVSQAPAVTQAPLVTRGPDIANSPAVPPELSKLPSGFSIFPVVPTTMAAGGQVVAQDQGQVCVSAPANSYYQAGPSYVASMAPHRAELTTIPMAWTGWPMTTMQPVNMRSPAKLEPSEAKHWEPAAAAYFRSPFS